MKISRSIAKRLELERLRVQRNAALAEKMQAKRDREKAAAEADRLRVNRNEKA